MEQIRQGSNVGTQTDSAYLGDYVNEISVLSGPYFLETIDDFYAIQDSEVVGGWLTELEEDYSLKVISLAYSQSFRNVFSDKAGTNPEEFSEMQLRSVSAPMWMETVKALGSEAVALPFADLYNGIQTGIVDGAEGGYETMYNIGIYEVADNIIETRHLYHFNVLVVSPDWFKDLPEEYQTILTEEADNAGFELSETMKEKDEIRKQDMIEQGMNYISYEELDIDAFKRSSQSAYDALDLNDARKAVYDEIGKTIPE